MYFLFIPDPINEVTNAKYLVMAKFDQFPNITEGPWDNGLLALIGQENACSEGILYMYKYLISDIENCDVLYTDSFPT